LKKAAASERRVAETPTSPRDAAPEFSGGGAREPAGEGIEGLVVGEVVAEGGVATGEGEVALLPVTLMTSF